MLPPTALLLAGLAAAPGARAHASPPVPLPHAYSHNDFEQARPLQDALDRGFCSVEADVFLEDGKLLVAHNFWQVHAERTLEALYLDPLKTRIAANGGRVYPDGPAFLLMIDVKTEPESTYRAIEAVLARYASILTVCRGGRAVEGAVAVVVTGRRSKAAMESEPVRYAAFDGRLGDLDSDAPASFMPVVSDSWDWAFAWRGFGPVPFMDAYALGRLVAKAHRRGRKIRFYANPDNEAGWKLLLDAGVDLINTDHLEELRRFLIKEGRP